MTVSATHATARVAMSRRRPPAPLAVRGSIRDVVSEMTACGIGKGGGTNCADGTYVIVGQYRDAQRQEPMRQIPTLADFIASRRDDVIAAWLVDVSSLTRRRDSDMPSSPESG